MDEQQAPIEEGHDDASTADKLAGLAEQMRQDVATGSVTDIEDALRERLADIGLVLDEQEFVALVAMVRS